jgi:hypothetical protein
MKQNDIKIWLDFYQNFFMVKLKREFTHHKGNPSQALQEIGSSIFKFEDFLRNSRGPDPFSIAVTIFDMALAMPLTHEELVETYPKHNLNLVWSVEWSGMGLLWVEAIEVESVESNELVAEQTLVEQTYLHIEQHCQVAFIAGILSMLEHFSKAVDKQGELK